MLDYAANGTAYWSIEQIRAVFEAQCDRKGQEPDAVLNEFLSSDSDVEVFWNQVKTNLQAGRIRMVFVADEIPPELRRIVEFLNTQMDPADVLALEVRQYVGDRQRTLVPRVFGVTAEAGEKKVVGGRIDWDGPSFIDALTSTRGPAETNAVIEILRWAESSGLDVSWGNGRKNGSYSPKVEANGIAHNMFTVWTDGGVQVQFGSMKPPFDVIDRRIAVLHRLNQIPGVSLSESTVHPEVAGGEAGQID